MVLGYAGCTAADPGPTVTAQTVTDAQGRFGIGSLAAGELTVTATHRDETATIGPERLKAGGRKDLTLRLAAGASLTAPWPDP